MDLKSVSGVITSTFMTRFYIPYSGNRPAPLEINGHRLIVLAKDKDALQSDLELVGADRIKTVKVEDTESAEQEFFSKLAQRNGAGVLVMPPEVSYSQLKYSLIEQLPWLQ